MSGKHTIRTGNGAHISNVVEFEIERLRIRTCVLPAEPCGESLDNALQVVCLAEETLKQI